VTHPHRSFPVSIKGVVLDPEGRVLLLRNDRDEWELPGGRIELGETPPECVVREVREETGWHVAAETVLDTWLYEIHSVGATVFIATYGCRLVRADVPVLSAEHRELGLFHEAELTGLALPEGYRRSIAAWRSHPDRR
jgi:8-oxo-dGTP pyrophosphatase MutT (NUDIX family)